MWSLKKEIKWIGFVITSELGTSYIPKNRTSSVFNCVEEIIQKLPNTAARKLAKFCGKVTSTKLVIGNLVQVKTRNWYKTLEQQPSWDSRIKMSSCSAYLEELFVLKRNLEKLNVLKIFDYNTSDIFATSDASSTGLAAFFFPSK